MAAGSGRRFGGPKQFLELAGRPVASWSVRTAQSVADGVVLVVPPALVTELGDLGADLVVAGGDTRAASVRAGLAVVPAEAGVIVVHDAARPLARASLYEEVIEKVRSGRAMGAIPVLAISDTVKRVTGDVVHSTIDREGLATVQTPQAFDASTLRSAHHGGADATDDAGLLELAGATVRTVPGDPRNVKITRPEDLELAELFLPAVLG